MYMNYSLGLSRDPATVSKELLISLMAGSAILCTTQTDNNSYLAYLKLFPVPSTAYCPYVIYKPLLIDLRKVKLLTTNTTTYIHKHVSLIYSFNKHLIRTNFMSAAI